MKVILEDGLGALRALGGRECGGNRPVEVRRQDRPERGRPGIAIWLPNCSIAR
jgi:hypothetical protein